MLSNLKMVQLKDKKFHLQRQERLLVQVELLKLKGQRKEDLSNLNSSLHTSQSLSHCNNSKI